MYTKIRSLFIITFGFLPVLALAQAGTVKTNQEKSDDDPTKVTTKVGVAWSDNYDMDDSDVQFSGSLALDEARKINVKINSDASEWRVGGSWLFPIGIFNFNFGKNDLPNGASQTNYSLGTFIPLSYFGFQPAGFQFFPMAGYSYNTGDTFGCDKGKNKACAQPGFSGSPSEENGFDLMDTSGSSGYIGLFMLKPLTSNLRLLSVAAGSYGSKNDDGDNYKGYFAGVGLGYSFDKHNSVSAFTYIQDNNTYIADADKRFKIAYKYQF
ncbi:hypothetical protein [Scandinavium lactucae]|uniref:Outer membrane protein beta-barrel domain-containing protein n=1 Tax=Scandinavium lactucae TaxID=3095028 RepID=A0ABU4QPE5_9ENTR|nr:MULTISPECIES: hypothetical protein [unclassified Scandinavium]MDX6041181.1 hypothetical protein [Scandinavium sp. V105_6]MDX6050649.1 hypothetical protein [Scandinavium sp. V105_1]